MRDTTAARRPWQEGRSRFDPADSRLGKDLGSVPVQRRPKDVLPPHANSDPAGNRGRVGCFDVGMGDASTRHQRRIDVPILDWTESPR